MSLVIATHNLMQGLRLPALIDSYRRLHAERGLDLLCVQENGSNGGAMHAAVIADALGASYAHLCNAGFERLAIVYDRDRLECVESALVPLPRLDRLSWFERLYIVGGKIDQKYAQVAVFRPRDGAAIAAANFHLDTAGTNEHRGRQMAAIADALRGRGERVVACGDTNAFSWRGQVRALRAVLSPLAELGAEDPDTSPTHYFARANEPKLVHKLGVLVGKLGLDRPGRYDVVCTNVDAAQRGQVVTPDSDHDLVWAALR